MNNGYYFEEEDKRGKLQLLEEEIKTVKAMFNVIYYIHENFQDFYDEFDSEKIIDLAINATKPFANSCIDYTALKQDLIGNNDILF